MLKWAYDSNFWQSKMVDKITEVGSTAHMPLASHEPRATVHLSFYKVPFHQFFFFLTAIKSSQIVQAMLAQN